ncbi:MAG: hypothetical protein AAF637_02830 [Pseudomonadota bacterium]
MEAQHRRRLREIQRRRGRNVNYAPDVRDAWEPCRKLSLAYLDAVVALHASGGAGAVDGWGKYAHLSPPEQVARQDLDHADWVLHMEDTPWFPGRTLDDPGLEALEAEILAAWSHYAFQAKVHEETCNCAGFDVERARLFRAGATAVGFEDDTDELAQLADGGLDLSGKQIEVLPPPEADRILGPGWKAKYRLPPIELRTHLIPDWEYPGYWLLKDNRAISCSRLADMLQDQPDITDSQLRSLRGDA